MKLFWRTIPVYWVIIALVSTLLCGGIFMMTQKILRQDANDPQIQLAYDIAYQISHGAEVANFINGNKIEVTKSLSSFVILYDNSFQRIGSNALLNGHEFNIPAGVLKYTAENGEDRVTWQPQSQIRLATEVLRIDGNKPGFIVVGRSLREVENRVNTLLVKVFCGWLVILLTSVLLTIVLEKKSANSKQKA